MRNLLSALQEGRLIELPTAEKIKSECCSGMNCSWVCVPCSQPFPNSPPLPMAIFDCRL